MRHIDGWDRAGSPATVLRGQSGFRLWSRCDLRRRSRRSPQASRGAVAPGAEDGGDRQLTGGIAHDFNNLLQVISRKSADARPGSRSRRDILAPHSECACGRQIAAPSSPTSFWPSAAAAAGTEGRQYQPLPAGHRRNAETHRSARRWRWRRSRAAGSGTPSSIRPRSRTPCSTSPSMRATRWTGRQAHDRSGQRLSSTKSIAAIIQKSSRGNM